MFLFTNTHLYLFWFTWQFIKQYEFKFLLLYNTYKRSLEQSLKFAKVNLQILNRTTTPKEIVIFLLELLSINYLAILVNLYAFHLKPKIILCKPLIVSGHWNNVKVMTLSLIYNVIRIIILFTHNMVSIFLHFQFKAHFRIWNVQGRNT